MLPDLQIKDNFLNKEEFELLNKTINNISFESMTNNDGNYGFACGFKKTLQNEWLFKKIKKQFFPNKDLQVSVCNYHLRHNFKKVKTHTDDKKYNFILYLKGKELIYNGTGFYNKNELNTYIGFVKNRAIFFDGKNIFHTDLQALGESSPRYTVNIFYD